jgi:hypothetical protein
MHTGFSPIHPGFGEKADEIQGFLAQVTSGTFAPLLHRCSSPK